MKSITVSVIIGVLVSSQLFAQGEFLKRGQWGVGAGYGYSEAGEIGTTAASVGISIAGVVDIGLSIAKPVKAAGGGYLAPSVTFYPSKQDDSPKKITFGISVSYTNADVTIRHYSQSNYGGSSFFSYTSNVRMSIFTISMLGAKKIYQDTMTFVQFSFTPALSYARGQSSLALAVGLSVGLGNNKNNKTPFFVITPLAGYEMKAKLFIAGIEAALILGK